jgi:hypothetical protein
MEIRSDASSGAPGPGNPKSRQVLSFFHIYFPLFAKTLYSSRRYSYRKYASIKQKWLPHASRMFSTLRRIVCQLHFQLK